MAYFKEPKFLEVNGPNYVKFGGNYRGPSSKLNSNVLDEDMLLLHHLETT